MSQILGKDVAQLKDQESIMVHDHWNINEKLDQGHIEFFQGEDRKDFNEKYE